MSLDGKIAAADGRPKWITNALTRKYVHQLRSEVDAILIGSRTLQIDNPRLTVRHGKSKNGKQPMAVVVGSHAKADPRLKIFEAKNREVLFVGNGSGRVDLKALLKKLAKRNITHVLVEGGGQIFSSFIGQRLIDRLVVCIAPKLLGSDALAWLPGLSVEKMKRAFECADLSVKMLGDNIVMEGELIK